MKRGFELDSEQSMILAFLNTPINYKCESMIDAFLID